MHSGLKKSILIISIEADKIVTEKHYFQNPANKSRDESASFSKDRQLLDAINLKSVLFKSVNLKSANKNKIMKVINNCYTARKYIDEILIICDRDAQTFSDQQIRKSVNNFQKHLGKYVKDNSLTMPLCEYLSYDASGDKFEDFLKLHFENKQIYSGYTKNDKAVYKKTMKHSSQAFITLKANLKTKCKNFMKIFKVRKLAEYE